ncbi:MAG: hypothetical protein MJ189_04565 [Coriobacteriales bacterium]|nr:hypothetical protein [Coriobacteriales bacterium]
METNITDIKELTNKKASLNARLALLPYDGTPEVKEINGSAYLYIRKRVGGKVTSKYVDVYSDELYQILLKTNLERREIKKEIRLIDKLLLKMGYEDFELSVKVKMNVDLARSNIKNSIYSQAVLEGIGTTFPQTEDIIENGVVSNLNSMDVQKILNLKRAWEFVLDEDTLKYESDFSLYCEIAKIVNEGFLYNGGLPRAFSVQIGGTSYIPPIPDKERIKKDFAKIFSAHKSIKNRAVDLCLYCMKAQIFQDGNKRSAVIFANHYLVSNGGGLLIIDEKHVSLFKKYLIDFYEEKSKDANKFLLEDCTILLK